MCEAKLTTKENKQNLIELQRGIDESVGGGTAPGVRPVESDLGT